MGLEVGRRSSGRRLSSVDSEMTGSRTSTTLMIHFDTGFDKVMGCCGSFLLPLVLPRRGPPSTFSHQSEIY